MKTLKAVAARYNATSLILRIVIGLVVGAVLALAVPGAGWVEEFGSLFVGALKGIAPVLVFIIVASALAQGTSKLDRRRPASCSLRPSFWLRRQNPRWCPRVWAR